MFRVCQQLASIVQNVERIFLLLLPLQIYRCIKLNTVLFSCLRRGNPCWLWSTRFTDAWRSVRALKQSSKDSQVFVDNRDFCLPHLYSMLPVRESPSEYCYDVWWGKTTMVWLPDG